MKAEAVPKRVRAHTIYTLADGTVVPGVTTVLQVLNKPALVPWANKLGLAGIDCTKYVDEKAAIGELAHQMIADHLCGVQTDTSEYSKQQIDQAENAVLSFLEWAKHKQISPIFVEEPMVSEQYRFGGTPDCLASINGEFTLLDIKTSAAIFPEMLIQVAAYRQLVIEHGHMPQKLIIVRIGRTTDEGFEERLVNHVDKRLEIFLHALAIYNLQKELRG